MPRAGPCSFSSLKNNTSGKEGYLCVKCKLKQHWEVIFIRLWIQGGKKFEANSHFAFYYIKISIKGQIIRYLGTKNGSVPRLWEQIVQLPLVPVPRYPIPLTIETALMPCHA